MRTWQTIRAAEFPRHVHQHAYAALVLTGSYEEAGDLGRFLVSAGDVILHDAFEAHLDRFPAPGVTVLNLRLPADRVFHPGLGRVDDPDSVVRLAEKSREEAAALLLSFIDIRKQEPRDWPEELATAIFQNPSLSLSHWSRERGIAPWSLSRGFAQVFGVSPSAFRARAHARHAWRAIRTTHASLAKIAAHCGFADQAHMTRSLKAMTGKSPQTWRLAANRFKTE